MVLSTAAAKAHFPLWRQMNQTTELVNITRDIFQGRILEPLYLPLDMHYPGSRGSLQGKRNERREQRASGQIDCKSHFHT